LFQDGPENVKSGAFRGRVQFRMQNVETLTGEQIGMFLKGCQRIEFQSQNRTELYGAGLHRQGDGLERTPDHQMDPQVPHRRSEAVSYGRA
jgi:hypothetical protein